MVSSLVFPLIFLNLLPFARANPPPPPNANHIFNAIHSSLRQWGSSLNHNGMSFFIATVPAHTPLYHGRRTDEVVVSMEWLAFEPEHALVFARPRGGGGPAGGGEPKGIFSKEKGRMGRYRNDKSRGGKELMDKFKSHEVCDEGRCFDKSRSPPPPGSMEYPHGHLPPPRPPPPHHDPRSRLDQHIIRDPSDQPHGYLHTYIPTNALRLLYIDGLSAGKTSNGTLDTQDFLLLLRNETQKDPMGPPPATHPSHERYDLSEPHPRPENPLFSEYERARELCDLSTSLWNSTIHGFLRMEGGFEIVLCSFEKQVTRSSVVAVNSTPHVGGIMGGWSYIQAVASRYQGLGRVRVRYDNFVSVFAYHGEGESQEEEDLGWDLWDKDVQSDTAMPRLTGLGRSQLEGVRGDVTRMVLDSEEEGTVDWQGVTDLVVKRYSQSLHLLHTNERVRGSRLEYAEVVAGLVRPFIDVTARDGGQETRRCVEQFVPPLSSIDLRGEHVKERRHGVDDGDDVGFLLSSRAIHAVTTRICTTLLAVHHILSDVSVDLSSIPPAPAAVQRIDELVAYLQWTTWKECKGCSDNEVCWIPIWPMGELEDHVKPTCRNESSAKGRSGYWGGRPFGGRPRPEKEIERNKVGNSAKPIKSSCGNATKGGYWSPGWIGRILRGLTMRFW